MTTINGVKINEAIKIKAAKSWHGFEYVELEDGTWLESMGDGRYYEHGSDAAGDGDLYAEAINENTGELVGFANIQHHRAYWSN